MSTTKRWHEKKQMIRLTTTKEQAKALLETMETFNEACNRISRKFFEAGVPHQMKLHRLGYVEARERFPPGHPNGHKSHCRALRQLSDGQEIAPHAV
ncbi:MAG: hypothetical protein ACYCTV_00005 [Leptospirales bacterium]